MGGDGGERARADRDLRSGALRQPVDHRGVRPHRGPAGEGSGGLSRLGRGLPEPRRAVGARGLRTSGEGRIRLPDQPDRSADPWGARALRVPPGHAVRRGGERDSCARGFLPAERVSLPAARAAAADGLVPDGRPGEQDGSPPSARLGAGVRRARADGEPRPHAKRARAGAQTAARGQRSPRRRDRALRELRNRRRQRIAIVLIDIDRFTLINDTLGHTAGDELMLQVAQRFAKALEGVECVLARWGSEQLAVLVHEVQSPAAVHAITTELQNARQEPFALRQHRVKIATRVGFTCIDSGLQRAEDALREADVALSVAKRQQSQLTVAYTPGMGGAAVSLVSLEADLHIALERNEFRLLFQPIIDLRGQRVVGAEALLRWRHPVEGLLTPNDFLPIAEEAGVIVPVTRWIIQRVCRLAAEWRRRLPQGVSFYISVNLSATVLRDPGLRDYVARVLEETRTPRGHLKFELTEGGLISNVSTAREALDALHRMGIELMLDDFGTGYSSLSHLQLFPFDYVKIDRPFVNRTGSERANNAITSAILQMTSSLGLRAVAEVVETQAAAQALLQMGCNFGQGYFFSAPVEAEQSLEQLRHYAGPATV